MIHDLLNIPMTDYPVLGIPAWLLINAIVNGVVYGFIIWLIYSIASAATGRGKKQLQAQAPSNPTSDTQEELTEHKDNTHKA